MNLDDNKENKEPNEGKENVKKQEEKKKIEEEKNDHEPSKCSRCKKICQIKHIECDQTGLIFHCYCFTCSMCGAILNELNVRIRRDDNQLFCASHAVFEKGYQPICKIYGVLGKVRVTF